MRQFRLKHFGIGFAITLTILACDANTFTALLGATPTPTRTPRATFTPRPPETPTPEESPTPEATGTSAATPTRTRIAATRTPTTRPSPAPPPPPQFPVLLTQWYDCPQSPQSGVYEIVGRVQRAASPQIFLGDYVLETRSADGTFRRTSASLHNEAVVQQIFGSTDCKSDNRWQYNLKMDMADIRGQSGFIARMIRSQQDSTPLSKEVTLDFARTVRWILYYSVNQ